MFRTYVRKFIYHFVINFLSASLIFPNTQSTKSVIENIAIGKYGIIIKIMEGKRDSDWLRSNSYGKFFIRKASKESENPSEIKFNSVIIRVITIGKPSINLITPIPILFA